MDLTAQNDSVNHTDRQAGVETTTPEEALELLARRLHWKMEHLDPTEDADWEELTDHQKNFYRASVRALLCDRHLLLIALD